MPPALWWKHFRQGGLPALAFVGVLIMAVWLWGENLANPIVMGQAESRTAEVTSPVDGEVMSLEVKLYDPVVAGQVLAVVASAQPDVLSNTLAVIRAEMDAALAEATFAPADQIRLAELQLEWLDLKGDVAALRANLPYTDAELVRVEKLSNQGIADQSQLELARANALKVREEIAGKEKAIATAEAALLRLSPEGDQNNSQYVQAQLRLATQQLRLAESELRPTILRAPLSGHLTRLYVQANAAVNRRQPLMTIADSHVERIIGYIPQPVRVEPTNGMTIEVRSRGTHRTVALSSIVNVGPRIELFDAPLRIRGMGAAQERGLPVVVGVPTGMSLRPGELVDLRLITD